MHKLNSRKFWMAIIGSAVMLANDLLGLHLPEDSVLGFAGIVVSYLVAQGWVDGKQAPQEPQTNG